MELNQLGEVVGERGGEEPDVVEDDEVEDRCMPAHEAIEPAPVPSQRLHDLEVLDFVPFLRKVNPSRVHGRSPPPERLVQGQHGDVGEVGHPSHRLQEPEALDRAVDEENVDEPAEECVRHHDECWGGSQLEGLHKLLLGWALLLLQRLLKGNFQLFHADLLPLRHRVVVQHEPSYLLLQPPRLRRDFGPPDGPQVILECLLHALVHVAEQGGEEEDELGDGGREPTLLLHDQVKLVPGLEETVDQGAELLQRDLLGRVLIRHLEHAFHLLARRLHSELSDRHPQLLHADRPRLVLVDRLEDLRQLLPPLLLRALPQHPAERLLGPEPCACPRHAVDKLPHLPQPKRVPQCPILPPEVPHRHAHQVRRHGPSQRSEIPVPPVHEVAAVPVVRGLPFRRSQGVPLLALLLLGRGRSR
mmetsp:Transcript_3503/g.12203  ORF Transcript_3503/g.12203 Transcript_3503/m.12203 type:complete len:416 (+) Transcript_3503:1999-3246(+)